MCSVLPKAIGHPTMMIHRGQDGEQVRSDHWGRHTIRLSPQGGIYWFTLIDSYSTSFGLIIITLFMCLGIAFFYGEC